jgi:hypothetical protein
MSLLTVEGIYEDGKIEISERPANLPARSRVLVTFIEEGEPLAAEAREELLKRISERMEKGYNLGPGRPYEKREELYDRLNRYK